MDNESPSVARPPGSRRRLQHVGLVAGLAMGGMVGLTAPFLVSATEPPAWLLLLGRWIPAGASLVALRWLPLPARWADVWAIRPRGWRRLLVGWGAGLACIVAASAAAGAAAQALGLARLKDLDPLVVLGTAAAASAVVWVSTLGEEVAWRGHLQGLLRSWGLWRSSVLIAGLWALWHVPLHAAYVRAGAMPLPVAVATTVALVPLGVLLSALVERFGSVWPAALAHAVPLSALVLLDEVNALTVGDLAAVTGLWTLSCVALAGLVARRRPRTEG